MVVWGVLQTQSTGKFIGIELFEAKKDAQEYLKREERYHPDNQFELLNMGVQPHQGGKL